MSEIPDCPYVPVECLCYTQGQCMPCVCGFTERALRAWKSGSLNIDPMTPEQREWCLKEIESIEGYSREDSVSADDSQLANTVLSAWTDYCRDKGMI